MASFNRDPGLERYRNICLLTDGPNEERFSNLIRVQFTDRLVWTPPDLRNILQGAGEEIEEFIPETFFGFQAPSRAQLLTSEERALDFQRVVADGGSAQECAYQLSKEEYIQRNPIVVSSSQVLTEAFADKTRQMSVYEAGYKVRFAKQTRRHRVTIPVRTSMAAYKNQGSLRTVGPAFIGLPCVQSTNPQGGVSFAPTKQVVVGLSGALKTTRNGDPGEQMFDEFAVTIAPNIVQGERVSVLDEVFRQLWQNGGPLMKAIKAILRATSDCYKRPRLADDSVENFGSRQSDEERMLAERGFCVYCSGMLMRKNSRQCVRPGCGMKQPNAGPLIVSTGIKSAVEPANSAQPAATATTPSGAASEANPTSATAPAKTEEKKPEQERTGDPCPFKPSEHRLLRQGSRYCDICKMQVSATAAAPSGAASGTQPAATAAAPAKTEGEKSGESGKPEKTTKTEQKHLWCDTESCSDYHKVIYTPMRTCGKCGNAMTREKSSDEFMLAVGEIEATRVRLGQPADKWAKAELKKFAERQQKAANASSASSPDNSVVPPSAASSTPSAT